MSGLDKLLERFGPVGGKVVLIGVPVAVGAALLATRRGGAKKPVPAEGPAVIGGGADLGAVAAVQNLATDYYNDLSGQIESLRTDLQAEYLPPPASPTPAPQAAKPEPISAAATRHNERVSTIVSGAGDYQIGTTAPTAQGGLKTTLTNPRGHERTVITPSDKNRQALRDYRAKKITREEMRAIQGRT